MNDLWTWTTVWGLPVGVGGGLCGRGQRGKNWDNCNIITIKNQKAGKATIKIVRSFTAFCSLCPISSLAQHSTGRRKLPNSQLLSCLQHSGLFQECPIDWFLSILTESTNEYYDMVWIWIWRPERVGVGAVGLYGVCRPAGTQAGCYGQRNTIEKQGFWK